MKKYIHNHTGASIMTGILVFLLLCASNVWAATYYVATTGNNSNSGTISSPFQTIPKGLSVMGAGDTLYIRGGTYTATVDTSVQAPPSGSSFSDAPLIAGYPGETVILRPQGNRAGIGIANGFTHHVIFDRLIIDGTDSSGNEMVTLIDVHHIRIQNSEVRNGKFQGLSSFGTGGSHEFLNIEVHHNGTNFYDQGIYIKNPDNIVDGCYFHDNIAFGIQVFTSGSGYNNSRNIIRNNRVFNNGNTNGGSGITVWEGEDIQIYNNLVVGNGTGITIGRTTNRTLVYDNTVVGNGDGITMGYATTLNTTVRGNIVWQSGNINDNVSGVGTVQDHNLVGVNPLFVSSSDYHLQSGSPAINAGVCFASVPTDITGSARNAPCDIGAYEFGGSGGNPVTNLFVSVQPSSGVSNTGLPSWAIQARDAGGVVVTTYNGTGAITVGTNPGGAQLSGATNVAFVSGVATVCCDLQLNKIGVGYTFVASVPALPAVTTAPFTITGTAPNVPTNVRATPIP